jgi:threonine dehydrogenase-like Zn-dependent dehydrogenase
MIRQIARSYWLETPGMGRIRSKPLPEPGADQVLVRTLYSGISRGTESLVFHGRVPPDQYQSMRAPHQEGEFPGPVKYGYITVGVVEHGPAALLGRAVFCLHPHQDYYVVDASAVVALPVGVPPARAVLGAYMETAVTACWDAAPLVGERIAVIGAGVLGCLTAWLLSRTAGIELALIDINPARAALAGALGLPFAEPDHAPGDCDLVIHASGHPAGLRHALSLAGTEGRIIELSWFGDQDVNLPLGQTFHSRRLCLRSSQVGRVPPGQQARWSHRRRLELALVLLQDDRLDALIDGESRFEDLPHTMATLAVAGNGALCHRVRYDGAARRSNLNSVSEPSA